MLLAATIRGSRWTFDSVREVLAKANAPRSGDDLAGISAREPVERVAARAALAELTLAELLANPVVPYEQDELTRLVEDNLDEDAYGAVKRLSVGQFREWLLDTRTTGAHIRSVSPGLTPEMAAAACKLMSNLDLMVVGAKCEVVVRANNTLGLRPPHGFWSGALRPAAGHPQAAPGRRGAAQRAPGGATGGPDRGGGGHPELTRQRKGRASANQGGRQARETPKVSPYHCQNVRRYTSMLPIVLPQPGYVNP